MVSCHFQHSACHLPSRAIELDRPLVKARAGVRRMHLQPAKLPLSSSPVEFIFLVPVEQVILRRSLFERGLYGQAHRDQSDTVFAVGRIKPRLVEIKRRANSKAVYGGSRLIVEEQDTQPQPSAFG